MTSNKGSRVTTTTTVPFAGGTTTAASAYAASPRSSNAVNKDNKRLIKIGNYKMTGKVLGKGHFARVEEAFHTLLNVKVAVKIISIPDITDSYVKKNLRREARILSRVSHPNIIYLFESLETEKHYYLITELGSGGDLCTYLKKTKEGKLEEKKVRFFGRQLVSAVGHLHEKGIVHRDLKMENILLDESQENIKLVDFGLSNFYFFDGLLKTHCGSPEYAAPELYLTGQKYGSEVDIWSLGVILYGMLVGRLPFRGGQKAGLSQEEKRRQLIQETKAGLTNKHDKILTENSSNVFRNLLAKMLNPNPKGRYSIQEVGMHAWIRNNLIPALPEVDENFDKKVFTKIAALLNTSVSDVLINLQTRPYGSIGGIYNIEKFLHTTKKLNSRIFRFRYNPISVKNSNYNTSGFKSNSNSDLKNNTRIYVRERFRPKSSMNTKNVFLSKKDNFEPANDIPMTTKTNQTCTFAVNNKQITSNSPTVITGNHHPHRNATTDNTCIKNVLKSPHDKLTNFKMLNFLNKRNINVRVLGHNKGDKLAMYKRKINPIKEDDQRKLSPRKSSVIKQSTPPRYFQTPHISEDILIKNKIKL